LYENDLAILANSWEDVSQKYATWKEALESRGLKVNIKKTKAIKVRVKRAKGPFKVGLYRTRPRTRFGDVGLSKTN